jgi:tetratricopeptide (TPR) repeat protein
VHWAERARLASPLAIDTLEHLARCHASLGDYAQAKAICRKVLAFAPNHLGVKEILARTLIANGETEAGIGELTRLVKASPGSTDALLALASTLRFAGRHQQALPFVLNALKNEPDHADALDAGRHLDGFDQMIALIANLDAVIGPDVSALHLAGALGRPGFVALPPGFPWYWAARDARSL